MSTQNILVFRNGQYVHVMHPAFSASRMFTTAQGAADFIARTFPGEVAHWNHTPFAPGKTPQPPSPAHGVAERQAGSSTCGGEGAKNLNQL